MRDIIQVNYQYTSNIREANQWLRELSQHPVIACDFEVATRYTPQERDDFQSILDDPASSWISQVTARSSLAATALDHPSHCTITHFQAAWSETDSYVFIITSKSMMRRILTYLTTTPQLQIWHNLSYDAKHIMYHTGKFPINYEDTQILAKTLLNHVEVHKAKTGLKDLAGHWYGSWGISADNFTLDNLFDASLIKYAATDPCATYKLWTYLNEECDLLDQQLKESYEPTSNDPPPNK